MSSTSHTHPVALQPPGTECPCVATHVPAAVLLEYHHIWPQEFGGPTVPENLIWICATAHNTVHTYLRAFLRADRVLRISELREALAAKGYPTHLHMFSIELAHQGFVWLKAREIRPDNTLPVRNLAPARKDS